MHWDDCERLCPEVIKQLPMEFAVEAQKLLQISLEGSVG
jgi:Fe-S cluster assembly protein SufB